MRRLRILRSAHCARVDSIDKKTQRRISHGTVFLQIKPSQGLSLPKKYVIITSVCNLYGINIFYFLLYAGGPTYTVHICAVQVQQALTDQRTITV